MVTVYARTLLALAALVVFSSTAAAQQPSLAGAQADFAAGKIDASGQRIGQGADLLVDLLLHKVTVRAFLRRHRIP